MRAEWSTSSTFTRKVIRACDMIADSGRWPRVRAIWLAWLEMSPSRS